MIKKVVLFMENFTKKNFMSSMSNKNALYLGHMGNAGREYVYLLAGMCSEIIKRIVLDLVAIFHNLLMM